MYDQDCAAIPASCSGGYSHVLETESQFSALSSGNSQEEMIMAKEQYILFLTFFATCTSNKKIHFVFADILVG